MKKVQMKADVFASNQSQRIIKFVREQYGDKLEFLWEKFPDNAIWRVPQNNKWYAALMRVARYKIAGVGKEKVDVLDVRYQRDMLADFLRHQEDVYPGWHMNKDNWISIILDESLDDRKVINLLENSRMIACEK